MSNTIDQKKYKELKAAAKTSVNLQTTANRQGVSISTMRRVRKSKGYADFKAILVKDRGPKYGLRGGTPWLPDTTPTEPILATPQKKKGLFARLRRR